MAKKAKNKKVSSFAAAHARRQREAAKAANAKDFSTFEREPVVTHARIISADANHISFVPKNGGTFTAAEIKALTSL